MGQPMVHSLSVRAIASETWLRGTGLRAQLAFSGESHGYNQPTSGIHDFTTKK